MVGMVVRAADASPSESVTAMGVLPRSVTQSRDGSTSSGPRLVTDDDLDDGIWSRVSRPPSSPRNWLRAGPARPARTPAPFRPRGGHVQARRSGRRTFRGSFPAPRPRSARGSRSGHPTPIPTRPVEQRSHQNPAVPPTRVETS